MFCFSVKKISKFGVMSFMNDTQNSNDSNSNILSVHPFIHPSIIPVIHFQKNKKIKLNWIEFQSDFNNFSENFYYKFNKPTSQRTTTKKNQIEDNNKNERTKKKVITKYRWPLFAKRRKKKYCCSIQSINFFQFIIHSWHIYLHCIQQQAKNY